MPSLRGYVAFVLAALAAAAAELVPRGLSGQGRVAGVEVTFVVGKSLLVLALVLVAYGLYTLLVALLGRTSVSERRQYTVRTGLRIALFVVVVVGTLAVVTEQWVGALVSLGVVGVAVSLALQEPLLNVLGWVYITVRRPFEQGDRIEVGGTAGDVVDVDVLVTTLWEVEGPVSTTQPSGRVVTVPNGAVLTDQVFNLTREDFPVVWDELAVRVAYESDLELAVSEMRAAAEAELDRELDGVVERYREVMAAAEVDVEVSDGPTVNIRDDGDWLELRLRYVVDPRRSQTVRNDLYRAVLERLAEHPERVGLPEGRDR